MWNGDNNAEKGKIICGYKSGYVVIYINKGRK